MQKLKQHSRWTHSVDVLSWGSEHTADDGTIRISRAGRGSEVSGVDTWGSSSDTKNWTREKMRDNEKSIIGSNSITVNKHLELEFALLKKGCCIYFEISIKLKHWIKCWNLDVNEVTWTLSFLSVVGAGVALWFSVESSSSSSSSSSPSSMAKAPLGLEQTLWSLLLLRFLFLSLFFLLPSPGSLDRGWWMWWDEWRWSGEDYRWVSVLHFHIYGFQHLSGI